MYALLSNMYCYDNIIASMSKSVIFVGLLLVVLTIVGWWKVFSKAGQPGILAIIPIVNFFYMCKIVWGSALYGLIYLVPVVGGIFLLITNYKLGERFGKGLGFGIGLVLLPYIFIPVLGFSKAEYIPIEE